MPAYASREPRASVVVPFRYRYQTFSDFVDAQSINISRSGMFIAAKDPLPIGTILDFEFSLVDGFALLKGKAEVVRTTMTPSGMGLRFQQLDPDSKKLIEKITEVNTQEGKRPTVNLDFADAPPSSPQGGRTMGSSPLVGATNVSSGVKFEGTTLRLELNLITAAYFTNNPLLNIRLGGFVVPGPDNVALGTMYVVTIFDMSKRPIFEGKGKVVAKHEARLGIRLMEPKEALAPVQAMVAKLAPSGK